MKRVLCLILLVFGVVLVECSRNYDPGKYLGCRGVTLKNGQVRVRGRGRFMKFLCNSGYTLAGEKIAICVRGKLDTTLPKCVRPTCSSVTSLSNGLIYSSYRGAVLNFFCKPGYQLKGSNITYCDGKKWDSNLPTCTPNNTRPLYSCDFETDADPLCGWTHDLNHDFDWRRMRFATPSGHIGTGPSYDHTKGNGGDGYYMYIESSSRFENDTARLISPVYDATENDTCFEFYYHMYGASTGSLRVYLKRANESHEFEPSEAFFVKSGNQGYYWYRSVTNLGAIETDFQIVIEGVRGPSYVSDIAIDDLKVIENCELQEDTTETTVEVETVTMTGEEWCENRCDAASRPGHCECNSYCVENNSCCPDYLAVCVQNATDYVTEPIETTEEIPTTLIQSSKIIQTITTKAVPTTTKTTKNQITTFKSFKPFTLHTIIFATTPPIIIPKTTQHTIRRIIPPLQRTSKPKIHATTLSTTYIPKSRPITANLIDDMLTVGRQSTTTEPLPLLQSTEQTTEDTPTVRLVSKIYRSDERENSKALVVFVGIGCVAALMAALVVWAVAARKCDVAGCVRLKSGMRNGSASDSQSDVRFLTGDEILNFNLMSSDDL